VFVTTRWTHVLQARGNSADAKVALSDLCAAYYAPVFAFIRRSAPGEDSARDLTQEFFARLLARGGIATVDPQRGRFRSFLLGAVKHFLADLRDLWQALL
jgi:RNA polymerase sigma-70 factor (ECF subfamily)